MSNKMIIDSSHPEETRVVVVKGNRLEEFDFETQHKRQIRGNIYLAKVTRVEPSLQAAFVDYGGNRHGFLAFSEIHPDYYQIPLADRQALLEEEAALAEAEDDDEQDEPTSGRSRRGRRRRGRGRRQANGHDKHTNIPAAEPVAMDAILAAWQEASADADTSDDEEDGADATEANGKVVAATVNGSDHDVVSEEPDTDDDDGVDATAEGAETDGDDDSDDSFDDVGEDDAMEDTRPRRRPSRRQYKIQEVIKRRQIILVQVVKEERGNKGAALTTYMSLAGRYSVLMPNTARGGGISRKITASADRKRLKDLVKKLDVPKGMGVILRTAGANRTQNEIERDYEYLMRLWDNVRDLTLSSSAPALVYEEGSLIKRSIRDLYNKDIGDIVVAGEAGYREARDFMKMLMPGQTSQVKPWKDTAPILARTGIEAQLDKLIHPQVTLKSGGYIIINQTEALVAIDVNSGKSTREHSIEKTALATNLEAAEEVARQLRLRDLAGLIVIDFIDMEENRNNRAVEKKLKDCLKNDRARIQVGRISHFGLLEMSRQRMRASVLESTMQVCTTCGGTGHVRSPQSVALHVIRSLEEHLIRNSKYDVTVRTAADTALYILNNKRDTLAEMEARFGVAIEIAIDNDVGIDMLAIDRGAVSERPKVTTDVVGIGDWDDDTDDAVSDDDTEVETREPEVEARDTGEEEDDDGRSKRRRRRRRRGRDQRPETEGGEAETETRASTETGASEEDDEDEDGQSGRRRKRRSRGRRGGRNRRGPRIPAAEPVGPLADLIAAEAEEAAKQAAAEAAAEPVVAEDSQPEAAPAPNGDARPARTADEAVTEPPAKAAEIEVAVDEVTDDAPEPAAAVEAAPDETHGEASDADDEPERVRATEETLNLDVEPVIVTENGEDEPKKKRAGWWARGKSWF